MCQPWHPDFLCWFLMLVVGQRPSLFWRRTHLHHLGYLGSFPFLSNWSCRNSPGATPMELLKPQEMLAMQSRVQARFKELGPPQLWFSGGLWKLFPKGTTPQNIFFRMFLPWLCMQCRKCRKSELLLHYGDSPSSSSHCEGCHGLSHFQQGMPFPFTCHCYWERDDPNSYWR